MGKNPREIGGRGRSFVLNVEVGSRSYELQLWWELPLCSLYLSKSNVREANQGKEERDDAHTRVRQRAWSWAENGHDNLLRHQREGTVEKRGQVEFCTEMIQIIKIKIKLVC